MNNYLGDLYAPCFIFLGEKVHLSDKNDYRYTFKTEDACIEVSIPDSIQGKWKCRLTRHEGHPVTVSAQGIMPLELEAVIAMKSNKTMRRPPLSWLTELDIALSEAERDKEHAKLWLPAAKRYFVHMQAEYYNKLRRTQKRLKNLELMVGPPPSNDLARWYSIG